MVLHQYEPQELVLIQPARDLQTDARVPKRGDMGEPAGIRATLTTKPAIRWSGMRWQRGGARAHRQGGDAGASSRAAPV